jgi:hypothetical protein
LQRDDYKGIPEGEGQRIYRSSLRSEEGNSQNTKCLALRLLGGTPDDPRIIYEAQLCC